MVVIIPAVLLTLPEVRLRPAFRNDELEARIKVPPLTVVSPATVELFKVVVPPVAFRVPEKTVVGLLAVPRVPSVTKVLPLMVEPVSVAFPPVTSRLLRKVPLPLRVPPVAILAVPCTVEPEFRFVIPPDVMSVLPRRPPLRTFRTPLV